MSGGYKQAKRIGELTTPLGEDKLILTRFEGTEAMSELFEFHIEAVHQERKVDFDSSLGQDCTVTLTTLTNEKRHFVGTLVEAYSKEENSTGFVHELVLKPWLWLLSQRINSRIFHDQTALDIIKDIINKAGESARLDDRCKKNKSGVKLEYVVQHNESDLDFICRLMEVHGIHYRFEFKDKKQKLVLGDDQSAFDDIPGSTRNFYGDTQNLTRKEEHFFKWTPSRHFTTGKVMLNDYDIMQPTANLKADKDPEPAIKYNPGQLEDYTHPYPQALNKDVSRDEGTKFAQTRIGSYRATDVLFTGTGNAMGAAAGLKVSLAKTPEGKFDAQYLITRVTHTFAAQQYRTGGGTDDTPVYEAVVTTMPAEVPYVPPLVTPKPFIAGPQTAKVVARPQQQSQEIDCDELGRIFVHFHWTREDETKLEGQSMACRVAQVWAGAGWGGIFIPRVGMEVLVHFLDGDPDRPIVIGTVYNGKEKTKNYTPYDLPEKKNIAGWKSHSTMQGGSDNYNEFYMDDTKGSELVNVQAEKDLKEKIKNDRTTDIGTPKQKGNDKVNVGLNRTTEIGVDEKVNVGNTMTVEAVTSITFKVGGSSIEITPTSITVKTTDLSTNGSASASHTAGGSMVISGATVAIN